MHKYVIMGVQGCGKGTQAKMLAADFDLVHISVGDLFRAHIQNRTKMAAKVKRIMAAGQLVPDEIVIDMVKSRLDEHDWNVGFILDGFPRNAAQAEVFLESYDVDAVIHVEVPDALVIQRVLARRACASCGADVNLLFKPPKVDGKCDACGGELTQRADDNEEAIKSRLADYHNQTAPVLDSFQAKERIVTVDGTAKPNEVQAAIRLELGI